MNAMPEIIRDELANKFFNELRKEFPELLGHLALSDINFDETDKILDIALDWGLNCKLTLEDIILFAGQMGSDKFLDEVNRHLRIRNLYGEVKKLMLAPVLPALKVNAIYDLHPPKLQAGKIFNRIKILRCEPEADHYLVCGVPNGGGEMMEFIFIHRPAIIANFSFDQKNLKQPYLQLVHKII